ncbi:hypothetical protein FOCC_FOCC006465, partial [Frankliniella occidentalis]
MDSDEWSDSEQGANQPALRKRRNEHGTPVKKKKIRNVMPKSDDKKQQGPKKFQKGWLTDEELKHWLEPVPDNELKARCKLEYEKNATTLKHQKNMKAFKNVPSVADIFKGPNKEEIISEKVKKAEIGVAAFFTEHNVALQTSDHLIEMLKKHVTDSEIVKRMTLDHTKCTAIVKNVLRKTEKENLIAILKKVKFSILVDESTDAGQKKNMVILVRYTDPETGKITVPLLSIIELDATDCSAEGMFKKFEEEFIRLQIPITNIIGLAMASDHANVMLGQHNSFASRLKQRCPWLVVMDCVCHSSHIAATNACKKLPSNAVTFVRRVATYMSGSPKRSAIFEEFQDFYKTELLKIKKVSATRWLVLHPCVVRILENWVPLQQYFRSVVLEDSKGKDQEAAALLKEFDNPYTKAYMYFLKYTLEYFNKMNGLFQNEKTLVHKLKEYSVSLLKQICSNYMRENHDLNTEEKRRARSDQDIKTFRLRCLDFYVTAAVELKKYLPVNNPVVQEAKFLDASTALSAAERQRDFPQLTNLTRNFK